MATVHGGTGRLDPLPLPDPAMWSSLGVVCGPELPGGHQSRVFAAERGGDQVVVKLTDGRLVDPVLFRRRVAVASELAEIDDCVVGPLAAPAGPVAQLGGWLAVVYPFVTGRAPRGDDEADVRLMGATMAALHRSLARLAPVDLPAVAALGAGALPAQRQLLHGDFSDANVRFTSHGPRVFDFDDCGYGPVEFEVANTLYMVLFDAALAAEMERYERFREWFVTEYRSVSGQAVADAVVEPAITSRIGTLGRWLDEPVGAPIGIRMATPEWRDTLREFVRSQAGRRRTW